MDARDFCLQVAPIFLLRERGRRVRRETRGYYTRPFAPIPYSGRECLRESCMTVFGRQFQHNQHDIETPKRYGHVQRLTRDRYSRDDDKDSKRRRDATNRGKTMRSFRSERESEIRHGIRYKDNRGNERHCGEQRWVYPLRFR